MRQTLGTFTAVGLGVVGFILILWGSSAFVGVASSQGAPAASMPSAPSNMPLPPDLQNPPPPDSPPAARPPEQTEAVVQEVAVFEGYSYDPAGRRDPFKPYGYRELQPIPMDTISGVPVFLEPLQGFELTDLKVIGIIWEVNNPKAMVRDPKNVLHMIRKDSKIGRNNGFVAAIREGEVVVIEPAMMDGLQTAATRIMTLQKSK